MSNIRKTVKIGMDMRDEASKKAKTPLKEGVNKYVWELPLDTVEQQDAALLFRAASYAASPFFKAEGFKALQPTVEEVINQGRLAIVTKAERDSEAAAAKRAETVKKKEQALKDAARLGAFVIQAQAMGEEQAKQFGVMLWQGDADAILALAFPKEEEEEQGEE